MRKFDLYVGCNVNGQPEYDREYVRLVVEQALENAGFDGATFTEAVGLWKGVSELTVICSICTDRERADVFEVAGVVKEHLHQESVMVIESEPRIEFICGGKYGLSRSSG